MLIVVETTTWRSENAGLFDFEARDVRRRVLRLPLSPFSTLALVRKSSDAVEVEQNLSEMSGRPLLFLSSSSDGTTLRVQSSTRHLWRRVSDSVALATGNWIRLGRIRLRLAKVSGEDADDTDFSFEEDDEVLPRSSLGEDSVDPTGADELRVCRICYEEEAEGDPLVSRACGCRGSMEAVHGSCLRRWIAGKMVHRSNVAGTACVMLSDVSCELCHERIPEWTLSGSGERVALVPVMGHFRKSGFKYLVFETKTKTKYVLKLDEWKLGERRKLRIGRAPDTEMRFTDISVSRLHAFLHVSESGKLYISDNNSRFGTLISDASADMVLRPGDAPVTIQAGRTIIRLSVKKDPVQAGPSGFSRFFCCSSAIADDALPAQPPSLLPLSPSNAN